jgi:hypothetical protein
MRKPLAPLSNRATPTAVMSKALAPLGERVARDGVFISRRGSGEGVSA